MLSSAFPIAQLHTFEFVCQTMGNTLLTGATGLVGRYLLRNLLEEGVAVTTVVRPGKLESARERIDGLMRHWESESGYALPRPLVLEGDLCSPGLGLSAKNRRWISEHVTTMLHCGASMTFREDEQGEPFRTNVGGTENVLQLCRDTGIRQFHHVSTCYICGLRTGAVLESELDLGQTLGNVYEQSKLRAEQLVRGADFLEQVTVYRPASVVGDWQTGYVTSCHGFYLPLQLAHIVASKIHFQEMNERFIELLGLQGDEGKNLVPVDWLASAIVALVTDPTKHGQTYHLASEHPVPVALIQRFFQAAIETYHPNALRERGGEDLSAYEPLFQEYMRVYESHWRDDPKFDTTNTRTALPQLPCPTMDEDALMRIARYPVERNFQLTKYQNNEPVFNVEEHLRRILSDHPPTSTVEGAPINLQVNGSGGGQWRLELFSGGLGSMQSGLCFQSAPNCYLTSKTMRDLAECRLTVRESIVSGRVVLEAPNGNQQQLTDLLQQLFTSA